MNVACRNPPYTAAKTTITRCRKPVNAKLWPRRNATQVEAAMAARESQNGSPGTRRTFKFEAQVRTSLSHTCLAGSSRPGLVQKRCMHVPTSQFQLAHKLHFAQLESLIDNNPADLRLELELPIFLADLRGQRKQIDHDQAVFPLEHLHADRPHILFPLALQGGQVLQSFAQFFGIALEIGAGNAVDGDAIAFALQRGRLDLVRFELRELNRESAFPTQFQCNGLGKRPGAAVIASGAREDIR